MSLERSVNKLTSKKVKPLKPKHVQLLTSATWHREVPISDLFRVINHRLRENHWVIAFKALITVHILMREGATDRVIGFVASNAGLLNMSNFRDRTNTPLGYEQSKNIRSYSQYLEEKATGYREVKLDFVRSKTDTIARFRSLPVENGLLREIELLQKQIDALLGCHFYLEEIDNVVTLQAFRLLIGDMMALFHLLNEAVIRILSEYFEMAKLDASRALQVYKNFATQTTKTVEFFEIARRLKPALGVDVPVFKHAPISLAGALEDYLKAPDFEAQRIAYKEKKAAKAAGNYDSQHNSSSHAQERQAAPKAAPPPNKTEAPNIDFFSSLDTELNAFNSPTVQAQYNNTADQFGSQWVPDAGSNPFGSAGPENPFAARQQDLQRQTEEINQQIAALQAGMSTNAFSMSPNAIGSQQQQQSQTFTPFAGQSSQAQTGFEDGFTVENVFGNPSNPSMNGSGFANFNTGPSSSALRPVATLPSAFGSQPQTQSADPFAGLGGIKTSSQENPTLDPFSFASKGLALAHNPSNPTTTPSLHNPFGQVASPPTTSKPNAFTTQTSVGSSMGMPSMGGTGMNPSFHMMNQSSVPNNSMPMNAMGSSAGNMFANSNLGGSRPNYGQALPTSVNTGLGFGGGYGTGASSMGSPAFSTSTSAMNPFGGISSGMANMGTGGGGLGAGMMTGTAGMGLNNNANTAMNRMSYNPFAQPGGSGGMGGFGMAGPSGANGSGGMTSMGGNANASDNPFGQFQSGNVPQQGLNRNSSLI
ncbi:ANTH domain-containing protein [Phlyctochytrium arcticum]|nr:ANTH domain-containing protein [Phlyctochytrium arcticum]